MTNNGNIKSDISITSALFIKISTFFKTRLETFDYERIAKYFSNLEILPALNEAQIRYIYPYVILPFLKPQHNLIKPHSLSSRQATSPKVT